MVTSVQQRPTKAHDPDSRYGEKATGAVREHPLDTQPMRDLAMQFEEWYIESRDKHAESRIQRFIDHDYYDHEQLTPAERAVYEARNQAPVIFNLIHGAIDWLSGTERRTRVDWNVLPRGPEDDQGAKALKGVVKYVSDANRAQWERSRAFKDAIISGVGFTEEFLRRDKSQEPVGFAYTDWRFLWWDPYSRDLDMGDARYFHRVKFTDLDRAIAMFPERAAALRAIAVNTIDSDYELLDELDGLPAMFALSGSNSSIRTSYSNRIAGSAEGLARRRVRLVETWYPRVQTTKKIRALIADCCDLEGVTFDATSSELAEKVEKRQISLVDSLTTRMSLGIWAPGLGLLQHGESPYKHNQFPFTPVWCFRHHRDGMPYGYVRGMRDAQDEYNKRRAKALFMASTNRVLFEEGAFSEEDEDESLEQIAMPNGEVRLAEGGLKKIEIQTGIEVSKANVEFQLQAKEHVYEGNGITRENLGQNTNAISGRAILAKQQQGAVTTAEVYDLYRLAFEISGQKIIENIKQGMSLPRMIRVLGTAEGVEWLSINQPFLDPETGEVAWENDLLNTLADYKVADQDFRETLRMAMAESLFEVIGKMPPEMALQLIDLAVELTDLPNKDEFVRRVRQLNGQMPTPPDPAQEEAAAAQSAAAQRDADINAEAALAKADKDRATAENLRANAGRTRVGAGADALQLAGQTVASAPLAVTADALLAGAGATPPTPVPSGVQPQ